jgi:hypothetical protein
VPDQAAGCEQFAPDEGCFGAYCSGREGRVHGFRGAEASEVLPVVEVAGGVDGAVVAEIEERAGVDLEVEVRRGGERVAGIADEADHLAGSHAFGVEGER